MSLRLRFDENDEATLAPTAGNQNRGYPLNGFLFGGDLNIRDWEAPPLWNTGRPMGPAQEALRDTWSLRRVRHWPLNEIRKRRDTLIRVDRLYFFPPSSSSTPPVNDSGAKVEGEETGALRCGRFDLLPESMIDTFYVSDHLGLVVEFRLPGR